MVYVLLLPELLLRHGTVRVKYLSAAPSGIIIDLSMPVIGTASSGTVFPALNPDISFGNNAMNRFKGTVYGLQVFDLVF
jgi:hypothetical protein